MSFIFLFFCISKFIKNFIQDKNHVGKHQTKPRIKANFGFAKIHKLYYIDVILHRRTNLDLLTIMHWRIDDDNWLQTDFEPYHGMLLLTDVLVLLSE